ncbi:hypothetical protein SK128_016053 [Halocaridina rubra]|uniref:Uncharacterized protein n=1 Tax=Halocaridina rubra TaxID=373956 RepID=A0AAN8XJS3_HALRR
MFLAAAIGVLTPYSGIQPWAFSGIHLVDTFSFFKWIANLASLKPERHIGTPFWHPT